MQLTEDFTVAVPADRLWEVLNDVESVAPCVPGFTLTEADHPDYRGRMKVKVGAISVIYDATITFVARDDDAKRVVLAVKGKEVRGAGSVDATVTSSLVAKGAETTAEMVTDVNVTGRVAQFGRGIIGDVSSRLTEQFVERLNDQVLRDTKHPSASPAAASAEDAEPVRTQVEPGRQAEALDLGGVVAVPVLKRLLPLVLLGVVLVALVRLLRR